MRKLVSTKEASEILGISVQGVHYRIKKNQLQSQTKDGKIFVYIDEIDQKFTNKKDSKDEQNIIANLKDEQILILKKSLKYLKKMHDKEIKRLENSHKMAIDVFNREIKLLQSAFNEMRTVYKNEIEYKKDKTSENRSEFLTLKEFFIILKKASKTDLEIKDIIINSIKNGDKRFIYNRITKKILIYRDDFKDLF
ncbi:hypothetical protein [Arcobacter porcinus]|uniref:Uncharacterized protein n=1 Tax=Arcobacter porcinus TaxID=1935204 RepID=A0A1C0AXA6_9BACT|nr:hypothetical protein [Arcobacter porcinus]OCL97356.1 hypothetical protein AAX27_00264 [Aliarcobacter thereius]OCL84271.1 hypothetical protein AAW30_00645 [Arcobacter porcinus]OCL89326.1 hypothetical protein AAX30_00464 [Arcobacter porcinus]OCL91746.1 hypothetical protein AAX28_01492 [Arcobacter porcinus]QEP39646.1 hypothetical protein APORC_0004 [Arcobacter porcinus]